MNWFSRRNSAGFLEFKFASCILLGALPISLSACSDSNGTSDATGGNAGAGANSAGAHAGATSGAHAGASAGGGESGGTESGGADSGGADSAGAAGSDDGTAIDAPNLDKSGQVLVSSPVFSGSAALSAEFRLTAMSAQCERTKYGACVLSVGCTDNSEGTTYASAGTIRLTSDAPVTDVSIEPDSSNVYPTANLKSHTLAGGEALHVAATGGDVPEFSADLKFPLLLTIDRPAADSTGVISAPTTNDLVLSFSRAVDGVSLLVQGGSGTKTLSCTSTSSNTLTVKAAALAALGSGITLKTYTVGVTNVPTAGWAVNLGTVAEAVTPNLKAAITIHTE